MATATAAEPPRAPRAAPDPGVGADGGPRRDLADRRPADARPRRPRVPGRRRRPDRLRALGQGWYGGHHLPGYSVLVPPLAAAARRRGSSGRAVVARGLVLRAARAAHWRRRRARGEPVVRGRRRVDARAAGSSRSPPGLAPALGALLAGPARTPAWPAPRSGRLTTLASPVAAAFLVLACAAWWLAGPRRGRRSRSPPARSSPGSLIVARLPRGRHPAVPRVLLRLGVRRRRRAARSPSPATSACCAIGRGPVRARARRRRRARHPARRQRRPARGACSAARSRPGALVGPPAAPCCSRCSRCRSSTGSGSRRCATVARAAGDPSVQRRLPRAAARRARPARRGRGPVPHGDPVHRQPLGDALRRRDASRSRAAGSASSTSSATALFYDDGPLTAGALPRVARRQRRPLRRAAAAPSSTTRPRPRAALVARGAARPARGLARARLAAVRGRGRRARWPARRVRVTAIGLDTRRPARAAAGPATVVRVRFTPVLGAARGRGCVGRAPGGWTRVRLDAAGPRGSRSASRSARVRATGPRCTD